MLHIHTHIPQKVCEYAAFSIVEITITGWWGYFGYCEKPGVLSSCSLGQRAVEFTASENLATPQRTAAGGT